MKRPIMTHFPAPDCNEWRILFITNGHKQYVSVMGNDDGYYSVDLPQSDAIENASVYTTEDVLSLIEDQGHEFTFRESFRVTDPLGRQLNFLQFGQYIQLEKK